jgi:RecB family exonuclease
MSAVSPEMGECNRIVVSCRAAERIDVARRWLESLAPATEALIVAHTTDAAHELVRDATLARAALAGVHRLTLSRLAGLLAADTIADRGLAPATGLAFEAIVARAVQRLRPTGALDHFAPVLDRPGFPAALSATVRALRDARVEAAALASLEGAGGAHAAVLAGVAHELAETRLVDRADMFDLAAAALADDPPPRFGGLPTLLLDVEVNSVVECDFVAALARSAPGVVATVPAGDDRTLRFLTDALGVSAERAVGASGELFGASSLVRLGEHLFSDTAPPERPLDDTVAVASAPGEMHECVEIARRIVAAARHGMAFDRIAVLLHDPIRYVAHLKEALARAGVPAFFARTSELPEPGGRALLALLACAADNFSARRYAEYLSLAQVPGDFSAESPEVPVSANSEFRPEPLARELDPARDPPDTDPVAAEPSPVVAGSLRAPWRWERLLVDAAVIGGADRWRRRLDGLAEEVRRRRAEIDEDDARAAAIDRELLDLAHLRQVALRHIDALAELPARATWGEWLAHLRVLTALAVRDSEPVFAALAELEPMGPVGPIGLDEARIVLAQRLGRLETPRSRRRYGAVMVTAPHAARGLSFDLVLVPGLAERIFPHKLIEDPVLPDAARAELSPYLARQEDRVGSERLALRLCVGAADAGIVFSYSRVDLDQGRPRVPSFYALEVLRAAEGRLPGFDELSRRAAGERSARIGWPAPPEPADAIDDAEFDLAVLEGLLDADPDTTTGVAHYLLTANPHLARALRFRARRWWRGRWSPADGFVDPHAEARAALQRHQPSARSFSPTSLQHFGACPYRFFLQAIQRLEPREEIEAVEVIDPLTRGALFHEVQFELLSELRAAGELPLAAPALDSALARLDAVLDRVAARWREELAPAIERVWRDGIDDLRADLREWLRRAAGDDGRWIPEHFELAFGLPGREHADPGSSDAPVALDGGLMLRGSIDLVERDAAGTLRVTDHKTGRVRAEKGLVIGGGTVLQPLFYGLAAERLLGAPVAAGRLYYCTAAGGFEERIVELDAAAREAAREFIDILARALADGFLPAAPNDRECAFCDYRRICGPYEEQRWRIKPEQRLADLKRLRAMR